METAYSRDEARLISLVEKYEQKVFSLALYLAGGDRDKAYDIATSGFAEALRVVSPLERSDRVLVRAAAAVIEKSRSIQTIPIVDDSDLEGFPASRRGPLRIIKAALLALPFDARAILILRDQIHLPYRDISAVLGVSEADARMRITHARGLLRKKVEEVLSHGG